MAQAYQWSTIAGATGEAGVGSADGPGSSARFNLPYGITVDDAGTLYVSDNGNHTIRKITRAGVVSTLAGRAGSVGTLDGTGAAARFSGPRGLVLDAVGNLFVADTLNQVVRKITPAGEVSTVAGVPGARGYFDGPSRFALFNTPSGVALDDNGNIFVSDLGNGTVRKITPAGVVSTLAGIADGRFSPLIDGVGTAARFGPPWGITSDGAGGVYVADRTIRHVTPAGVVTTVLGSVPIGFFHFNLASGITVDHLGAIYVADQNDQTVRVIRNREVIVLGGLGGGFVSQGSADGIGSVARFWRPSGVAVDRVGTLYVTDQSNNTIRKGAPLARPAISLTRQDLSLSRGATATFTALVGSLPAPTVQWFRNNIPVAGATSAVLTISSVQPADTGSYSIVATNSFGSTSAQAGSLIVLQAPVITAQPQAAVLAGSMGATLRVSVAGLGPFTFQWLRDGQTITGATDATHLTAVPGSYSVIITSPGGAVTSATVTVASGVRLVNLATRGFVGAGPGNGLVAGFVVGSGGPAGKRFLVRAIGPTLGVFGVPGTLARPTLTVFRGAAVISSNESWGSDLNAPAIPTVAQAVGAFPLAPGSADAAVLLDAEAGAYTVQVDGANASSGTALVEIYETSDSSARLINLSTRGRITASENIAAGFVVRGPASAQVLVRAVGPGLAQFGLEGLLARPLLTVFEGSRRVDSNDGWAAAPNAAQISTVTAAVGAFSLPGGSADAVLLLTVPAGTYSAEVSGVAGATGIALMEVYEVP